ncbi:hypothetical protein D9M72_417220 [compost metagenome]
MGRTDRPADRQCCQREPGQDRGGREGSFEERGNVRGEAKHDRSNAKGDQCRRRQQPPGDDPRRQDRLGRPALDEDEYGEQDCSAGEYGNADGGGPVPRLAAFEGPKNDQRQRASQQARPQIVDPVPGALDILVERSAQHPPCEEAQWNVHEEDPAPHAKCRKHSTERRPNDGGHRPNARKVALHLRPLSQRIDIPSDRDRHRLDCARAQALQYTERDEGRHAPGHSAEDRTE